MNQYLKSQSQTQLNKFIKNGIRVNYFDGVRLSSEMFNVFRENVEEILEVDPKIKLFIDGVYYKIPDIYKQIYDSKFKPSNTDEKNSIRVLVEELQEAEKLAVKYLTTKPMRVPRVNYTEEEEDEEEDEQEQEEEEYDPDNLDDEIQELEDKKDDTNYYDYVVEEQDDEDENEDEDEDEQEDEDEDEQEDEDEDENEDDDDEYVEEIEEEEQAEQSKQYAKPNLNLNKRQNTHIRF